jgi:hypothetical protein
MNTFRLMGALAAAFVLLPVGTRAETNFTQSILFQSQCGAAIEAAVAYSNGADTIYRIDEKTAAYAFILGIGANDPRDGTQKEAFGRGIGAAVFFCNRNPDVSIFQIGRMIGQM